MKRNRLETLILLGDMACAVLALVITIVLRFPYENFSLAMRLHLPPFTIVFIIWMVVFYVMDITRLKVRHQDFIFGILVNFALTGLFFYAFPSFQISPKTNLLLLSVIFFILGYTWRKCLSMIITKTGISKTVILMGHDASILLLAEELQKKHDYGYTLQAIMPTNSLDLSSMSSDITIIQSPQELLNMVDRTPPFVAVFSNPQMTKEEELIYTLLHKGIRVQHIVGFWEEIKENILIYSVSEQWFNHHMPLGNRRGHLLLFLKRFLDIVMSLIMMPFLLLIFLAFTPLIKLSGKGPIIHRQTRIGMNERPFTIYKFRTMKECDTEKQNPRWTVKNDDRVTRVGKVMRVLRLDEWPQIINILKGDMSLIGPRPEHKDLAEKYAKAIPHYLLRYLVRPGLSGWAQVKYRYGSSVEDAQIKLAYDLYYVKNFSFFLDFRIALKTLFAILSKTGH